MTIFHPLQVLPYDDLVKSKQIPEAVALRAYDVYAAIHGEQKALIDLEGRNCRGGFGVGELVAFLYARSFPKEEWSRRVDEACETPPVKALLK